MSFNELTLPVKLRISARITLVANEVPARDVAGLDDDVVFANIETKLMDVLLENFPDYNISLGLGTQRLIRDY